MEEQKFTWRKKNRMAGRLIRCAFHVLLEKIYPTKAWKESDVPRSYKEITPEWLTAVLCKGVPGAKILAVEPTGGSVGTSSRQGLVLSLNAQAEQAGIPHQVFTKATPNFSQRLVLGVSNIIWGEIAFYNFLRNSINIESPKGYHACVDAKSLRSMILMEDIVATKGARFISTETYINKHDIKLLLTEMAKLHAHFWEREDIGHEFDGLHPPLTRLNFLCKVGLKKKSLAGVKRAASVIPHGIINRQEDLWRALRRSFELNLKMPQTILHGDSHIGQAYITSDGEMGMSDWQTTQRGGWAFDFAYLVNSSLTVADRRQWESELLQFYLDRLQAEGGPGISYEEAWLSYRQHGFWPYFAWVFTIGAGGLQPDEVSLEIIERTANAINDHDAISLFDN